MFDNILGHESQKDILKSSIAENTISHSYLFSGPTGIGKYTMAREFAKILLNTDNLDTCSDYIEISKRDDKKNILVEQIRDSIIDNVFIAPSTGSKKVYIIDDAEYLNDSAQNALLKTLEEPPSYVCIILISCNNSTILPTVLSRVNKIEFGRLNQESVKEYMRINNISVPDNIIEFCDGSIGLTLEIVNEDIASNLLKLNDLYSFILEKDLIKSFKKSEEIDFNKKYMLDYFEYIFFINNSFLCVEIIEKIKERLKYNGNYDIVIDNMILKCIDNI